MNVNNILAELYTERARIDAAIKALESITTSKRGGAVSSGSVKTRKMSKAARARIAAAQRKRWAAQKAAK